MLPNEEKENKLREKRFLQRRTTICVIIIAVIFAGFGVRLFKWQIIDGPQYKKLAVTSTAYTVSTDATRGEILDRDGNGLAVNRTGYRVAIDRLFMKPEKLNPTILKLIKLMEKRREKWIDVLPIKLTSDGKFKFKDNRADDIKTMKSEDYLDLKSKDSAEKCIKLFTERYELEDYKDKEKLRDLISVHYNMELNAYSNTTPYIFAKNISSDMVAIVSENTQGISGVEIQTFLTRHNPNGTLAPHIVGALGSISQEEYEEKTKEGKDYGFNDSIGKFGVESAFEDELKGTGGERIVQKDSDGNVTKVANSLEAKPGHTIYLTLDAKLQRVANESLKKQVTAVKANSGSTGDGADCETGAVVMLSVKDFSVLAAASYPSYDLNRYSNYDDYYVSLAEDENAPLYDRAFNGSFAPGSTFKPCVACAALQEGVITPTTSFNCTKNYTYYPSNPVACMGYHSYISLNSAITQSCNYFFAETGRQLGIETMYLYAEKFGLGEKTGLEVAESRGFLAGRDSTTWQEGNTVQAAIGQSDNAFTPVQLAAYAATIANDGVRLKTHIVKEVRDYERKKIIYKNNPNKPEKLNTIGVSAENLNLVQDAMRNVVASPSGTANYIFGNYKIPVAAKTGTAENSGSDHTVFICYAPFDKPEVAIGVVIEHGAHGQYSMNVAKDLLNAYFK